MAFIIFWASTFAFIFFLIGGVCKILASIFSGGLKTIEYMIVASLIGGGVLLLLELIYEIANEFFNSGLGSAILFIFVIIICIVLILWLVGWLGEIVIGLMVMIVGFIPEMIFVVLEWAADICEKVYGYFLNIILKQLKKN